MITTIYLHRVLSHKSIELHPAMIFFMRICTWMLTSISPREWVAVHCKHHNFTDVEGDPHSPHIEGYWKIMLANVYYRREANKDGTLQKYACDLPHELVEALRLAKVTSKVDEGWDKHRRRIPPRPPAPLVPPQPPNRKAGKSFCGSFRGGDASGSLGCFAALAITCALADQGCHPAW